MKILDKIKNAIFEEEEFDEEFNEEVVSKKKPVYDDDEQLKKDFRRRAMEERAKAEKEVEEQPKKEDNKLVEDIVKQIDVDKTVPKRVDMFVDDDDDIIEAPTEEKAENPLPKRENRKAPIIFDDTDFDEGVQEIKKDKAKEIDNENNDKSLYGGYRDEKSREKFRPSPNISPVYGLVEVSPVLEKTSGEDPKENHVYVPHKQEEVSLDDVRQKAFGNEPYFEEDEDLGLLYEMEKDDKPAVSKVTIGDAEEYFDDLGLEYNVDYTDKKTTKKETRSTKNKELTEKVEEEIKLEETKELDELKKVEKEEVSEDTGEIETLDDLEITKEQIKPRTAEDIKKAKKVEEKIDDKEDPDEKNLYDLIDMMYDSE